MFTIRRKKHNRSGLKELNASYGAIYIIATGHEGLEVPKLMERFNDLPYKNKVMFTYHEWPQYDWAKHVRMLDKVAEMPPLTEFATMTGKRIYDTAFDPAEWIAYCERQ